MAAMKKVRDGLYFISWIAGEADETGGCQVTFDGDVTNDGFRSIILEYVLADDIVDAYIEFVDINDSFKANVEEISIEASLNGVQRKMAYDCPTCWKASWNPPNNPLTFDIVFDLTRVLLQASSKPRLQVLDHLENLWKNKPLTDVIFNFDEESYEAHTMILASGSPVFATMFENPLTEGPKRIVEIKDIRLPIFQLLLRFIYTGDTNIKDSDVTELLVAARKYQVVSLKEECASRMVNNLSIDNATQSLIFAHLNNCSKLYETALQFMAKNAKKVCARSDWLELIKNYPELCFQVTQLIIGF